MSLFKRITTTISARVDQLVGEIENHDAVIEAAIKDARQATAKAKVRLQRLIQERQKLESRIKELTEKEAGWTERAKHSAGQDEDKALACLRRRRECQRQIAELSAAVTKQREAEEKISTDVRQAETRINEMNQKRSLMRTRESAAEALANFSRLDEVQSINVDDTFDRWEIRITEAETRTGANLNNDALDSLEREFVDAEERESLRSELAALTKGVGRE